MNNRFVFIMPAYNAQDTIARAIMSVWFQTYPSWKIIIRDDMSTDKTLEAVDHMRKQLSLGEDRLSVTSNTEKMWEIRNILEGLKECDSNDIVCRLDGDDWLCDSDALTIIDHKYKTKG